MDFNVNEYLKKYDGDFAAAKEAAENTSGDYTEIPSGKYVAQIVGMTWKELKSDDPEGFSAMGPCLRIRIVTEGSYYGWYETVNYWLIVKHPARDIHEPEFRANTADLFSRMMARIGCPAPDKISELPAWSEPIGRGVALQIKEATKGDRTYRNVYLNGKESIAASFPVEAFNTAANSWGPLTANPLADIDIPF